jgi:hypothetical protein
MKTTRGGAGNLDYGIALDLQAKSFDAPRGSELTVKNM